MVEEFQSAISRNPLSKVEEFFGMKVGILVGSILGKLQWEQR